jgi:hypothetical protein
MALKHVVQSATSLLVRWVQLKANTEFSFTDWLTANGYPYASTASSVCGSDAGQPERLLRNQVRPGRFRFLPLRPICGNICAKDEEVTMEESMRRPPPCLRTDP